MVLRKLKNILPIKKSYSSTFKKIIQYASSKSNFSETEINNIYKAYEISKEAHKGQLRRSGEPYFNHCIDVAYNLTKWNMNSDVIIAGILHDVLEDTNLNNNDIINNFGMDIYNLVEGVTKLSDIKFNSRQQKQAENFMKMFLSVATDIRVIIIKFSDRLHNMQTINFLPLILFVLT